MTEDLPTAEEERWLAAWADKRRQIDDGTMTPEDVREWVWKNKVLNAINVTIQRIKRSERPGRDPRLYDNTWVTIAAERGRTKEETSRLAVDTLNYVIGKLEARGHVFDVDWMVSSRGVIVISINVKALRAFMNRKTTAAGRPASPAALDSTLDLFEAGVELMRQNLRRADPAASDAEIDRRLEAWLRDRPGAEAGDSPGRAIYPDRQSK